MQELIHSTYYARDLELEREKHQILAKTGSKSHNLGFLEHKGLLKLGRKVPFSHF